MEKDIEFIKELIKRLCEEYKIKKILNLYGVNINEIRFIPTRKEKVVKNKKRKEIKNEEI